MIAVNEALGRIRNILDVEEDKLTLLTELTQIQAEMLAQLLGEDKVPSSLTFIVVETTVARYRKIGAEGISNKRVDVIQNKYAENLFEPYMGIISDYNRKSGKQASKIVRVI